MRVCHFHGNPNSYNAAISFLDAGDLIRFHTSLYAPAGMRRRFHRDLPKDRVTTHPAWEAMRLAVTRMPFKRWNGHRQAFVDLVARKFDAATARAVRETDGAVYCYEDSASMTFARARHLGARRIYELPIMHYREMRRVFQSEVDQHPELAQHFQTFHEPQWKLDQKDEELAAAEVIVVPATFVRDSVERFLSVRAQFVVVPYGADVSAEQKRWTTADAEGPLRLLFVGILGPRKGLHLLFEVLARMGSRAIHLTLAGRWQPGFREWLASRYPVPYDWVGSLDERGVNAEYRKAHVLVLPSLAEGFALVISEAMASGIPVIATERSAAPDLIDDRIDGWITAAGDSEGLQARIESLLENRGILPEIGAAARRKAELFSWERYRKTLRAGVFAALSGQAIKL